MAQQFDFPETETQLREIQDKLYQHSKEVYEAVKDRVEVTPIGEIPLKGKTQGVFIYQLDEVKPVRRV